MGLKLIGTWRAGVGPERAQVTPKACGHFPRKDTSDPEPYAARTWLTQEEPRVATANPDLDSSPQGHPSASSILRKVLTMTRWCHTWFRTPSQHAAMRGTCHSGAHHDLGNATVMREREHCPNSTKSMGN